MEKKKKRIMAKSLPLLVTVASLSVVLAVGISITAAGLSANQPNSSGSSYKQMTCVDKVLEFGQEGIVRDVGGFNGGLYECSQIHWTGSIYGEVTAK
jgi:hypothetical protein